MNTINHSAFSTAEHHFKAMLTRIEYYDDMSNAMLELGRILDAKVYIRLRTGQLGAACALVNLCYDMDFITWTEASNIKRWLYWYDDPDRLNPESHFFKGFRYE